MVYKRREQAKARHRQPAGEQDYETMSTQELRARAREAHIEGRSRMNREELIEALRQH